VPVVHCATRFEIASRVAVITRCRRGRRATGELVRRRLPRAQDVTVTTAVVSGAQYRPLPTFHGTCGRLAVADPNGSYHLSFFSFQKLNNIIIVLFIVRYLLLLLLFVNRCYLLRSR